MLLQMSIIYCLCASCCVLIAQGELVIALQVIIASRSWTHVTQARVIMASVNSLRTT